MFTSDYIALLALVISLVTAYLTLLHRGAIKMTRPSLVVFLFQQGSDGPKIFLRTLLYSTSRRGQIIESMWIKLHQGNSCRSFPIWAYGDDRLVQGSGLHVGFEGHTCYHHFLLAKDGPDFRFAPGQYVIEVYAALVNAKPTLLARINVSIDQQQAVALQNDGTGVFFSWDPEAQAYRPHLDQRTAYSATLI